MKLDKSIAVLAMVASLFLAVGTVAAQDGNPGGATVDGTETFNGITASSSGSISPTAGNVTEANLSRTDSTSTWAGIFGNATGGLELGENGGNTLYSWDADVDTVLAAEESSVDFTTIEGETAEDINDYYGLGDSSDNATETFDATNATVTIGESSVEGNTAVTESTGSTDWETVLSADDNGVPVFAGNVVDSGTAFNGDTADYQIILPAGGTGGDFSMYLELS